jgi:predicted transcriptional regulator
MPVLREHNKNTMAAKSPRLSVTLTEAEMSDLQKIATGCRVSCSWVAHQAIAEFLEKNADPQKQLPLHMKRGNN